LQKVSAPRFGAAIAAVAFLLTGGLVAHPAQAAETAAVTTVSVASGNSADITTTTAGAAALQEFAAAVSEMSPETAAKSLNQLQTDYRVLQVDMAKVRSQVAPGIPCTNAEGYANTQDVLIAPRGALNIRYVVDEDQTMDPQYNPTDAANRCNVNILWDEADTGNPNDDPDTGTTARPYDYKYASDCFARKKYYVKSGDRNWYFSWNDGCYANWVVKYDGDRMWNYYTVKAMSSCKNVEVSRLTSCGHGIKQNKEQNLGAPQWDDWAPNADSVGDCRTKSVSVSSGPISISGDYTHCETQKIYKYSEAGKMSSYWKGKKDGTRGTQHQVAVKYPPSAGRPHWTHGLNSDGCLCLSN
jgi:hypothetical protein